MAVRDFTSHDGRQWRAWDVLPESIQPLTKAEDYLAECYRDGWVVFETVDGREKRRLCPPPYGWQHRSDQHLEELLARADILRPRGELRVRGDYVLRADLPPSVPVEVASAVPRNVAGDIDMRYLSVVRSFRYPGGEVWRASVVEDAPERRPVLRFSSASQTLDLASWPADWADLSNEALVALMQRARSSLERRRELPEDRSDPDARAR